MCSVPTRWNSVAETLRRSLYLRLALEKLIVLERHNTDKSARLKRFKLRKEEWELLTQLEPILSVNIFFCYNFKCLLQIIQHFLKATERMSQSKTPLLYQVVPIIDALTRMLEIASDNEALFPAVRAAATKGIAVLNKYYAKTDESIMYRCAMSKSLVSTTLSEIHS